jgi:hypothetical protein
MGRSVSDGEESLVCFISHYVIEVGAVQRAVNEKAKDLKAAVTPRVMESLIKSLKLQLSLKARENQVIKD